MTAVAHPTRGTPATPASRLSIRPEDVVGFLAANIILILAMWIRHGGLDQLGTIAGLATATGQLTALIGTFLSLIQLLLMSRAPWLDAAFGRDRLAFAHRWIGFATVWLIVGHAIFTTIGFAMSSGESVLGELWLLITTWDFVLMATVSLGLLIAVAVTSVRLARRSMSYETWYGIHLYAYLAIALGFAHQLVVGTDFVDDPIARIYWIALYVMTIGTLIAFRFGAPVLANLRHRFRVANVVHEAPGVASIYLTGHDLERFPARAGQYLTIRFMTWGWWRSHPYSLSADPNGRWLRVTIKDLGDDSARAHELPIGTHAIVEGAYGNLTTEQMTADRALLIAGGIGVTPLRAILEELAGMVPVTLIYRARHRHDIVFGREIEVLAQEPDVVIDYQVGSRRTWGSHDPLSADAIERLVPDVAQREVYLCGPSGFMDAAQEAVLELGVPPRRIHQERFFDD
jgi:predicted ferric reductase